MILNILNKLESLWIILFILTFVGGAISSGLFIDGYWNLKENSTEVDKLKVISYKRATIFFWIFFIIFVGLASYFARGEFTL